MPIIVGEAGWPTIISPKRSQNIISRIDPSIQCLGWINQRSLEALSSFVLGLLDSVCADLASQLGSIKGFIKGAQQPSSKSQKRIPNWGRRRKLSAESITIPLFRTAKSRGFNQEVQYW